MCECVNSKMCNFKILKLTLPDNFHITSPEGVCVMKLESNDILIIWFHNTVLINQIYNLNTERLSLGKTMVLSPEFKILDVLQLGNVIGILTKEVLYLLQYANVDKGEMSSSKHGEDTRKFTERSLNMIKHISLHGVLMLGALQMGLALTKKKGHKIFVDVHKTDLKMRPIGKLFSIQLPTVASEHSSQACVMTTVKTEELDTALTQLLLQDLALLSGEIIFVGIGSGQVFFVPIISKENEPISGGQPKLLYSTTQAIKGILFVQDSTSTLYSHIAIILYNGPMVYISSRKQKLHYQTVYLPSSVHAYCQAGDGIVMGNGMDLWHCKLTWSAADFEDENTGFILENAMLMPKGVDVLCYVKNANHVLAVTVHLTLYLLVLNAIKEEDVLPRKPKNFTIPSNLMQTINRQEQCLIGLHQQLAHENQLLGVINISKHANLLRNCCDIDVEVNIHNGRDEYRSCASNFLRQYLLKIKLKNKTDQEFLPDMWSLHLTLATKDLILSETKMLKHKWSAKMNVETVLHVPFLIDEPVEVVCHIISEIAPLCAYEIENSMGKQWVTIPIAIITLDLSYFFELLLPISARSCNKNSFKGDMSQISQELLEIVKVHIGEGTLNSASANRSKLKELKEHMLLLTRNEATTPEELWNAIAANCNQRSSDIAKTDRKMHLKIGNSLVKAFLNEQCNEIELYNENISLLHHVKRSLIFLLRKQMLQSRESFTVSANLLTKAQKLKAQVHMLSSNDNELHHLRQEWRNVTSKSFTV